MKKYFNEDKKEFKLVRGTINELKDYHQRTDIYLTQDEDTDEWYMSFTNRYKVEDVYVSTVRIPYFFKITKENLAALCGYEYDEDENYIF